MFYCTTQARADLGKPKLVSMIRKYHNHKLQTNQGHREEEPHSNHGSPGRQTKQSNQLSFPLWDNNCKFGNFRENLIFANSVKRHICQVINSRLWHDLFISVNDNEFSPFREAFIFAKLRIREVSRK